MILKVSDTVVLELLDKQHAPGLHLLKSINQPYLSKWLSWVDQMQSVADFEQFIFNARERYNNKIELPFTIVAKGNVAGRIGLNYMDNPNKTAAIGYWLGESYQGQGIITSACQKLIQYAFTSLPLNRLELKCGTENYRSQAIAERLHFSREGIIRQGEWLNGRFIDLYLYSMLKEEWLTTKNL